jgi:hypothetical protein
MISAAMLASLFWRISDTRFSGVTEAGRTSAKEVLRVTSLWKKRGTNGAVIEILADILVSKCGSY